MAGKKTHSTQLDIDKTIHDILDTIKRPREERLLPRDSVFFPDVKP